MARDAWVSSQVDKLLEQARAEAEGNPMLLFEEIEPQQARALLESAMKATGRSRRTPPPVSDSYSAYHAFARARMKALPPGRKRPAPLHIEAPYSRDRRAMLAAEFLASDAAEHLSDPVGGLPVRRPHHRLRLRPGLRPAAAGQPDQVRDVPARLAAAQGDAHPWPSRRRCRTCWRPGCASPPAAPGCPRQGLQATLDAVWEATAKFAEAYRDPTSFGLDRPLLERLLPDGDLSALARRAFAFPFLQGTHGDDRPRPAEPGRRGRPAGPAGDRPRRRAQPARLEEHLAWHEEIASRLWEGDPPQLWEAAQRLLDLGHDRHDVLHVLIEIAERIGDDPDELAAALDDIADIPDEL